MVADHSSQFTSTLLCVIERVPFLLNTRILSRKGTAYSRIPSTHSLSLH
ncbi:Uncharacterised protein [Vibrio cholerae]|nr:Uncharacterised protein [Vibrio cholerae]CSI34944.1 Uncharacterised protein [Vibrio cholerae]